MPESVAIGEIRVPCGVPETTLQAFEKRVNLTSLWRWPGAAESIEFPLFCGACQIASCAAFRWSHRKPFILS